MKAIEDYYHKWIKTDKATKYRNSPKYRYSEMIAFTDAYAEYLKTEYNEVIKLGNGFIEVNGKKYKDVDSRYVLMPKQFKEIKELKEALRFLWNILDEMDLTDALTPEEENTINRIREQFLNNQQ